MKPSLSFKEVPVHFLIDGKRTIIAGLPRVPAVHEYFMVESGHVQERYFVSEVWWCVHEFDNLPDECVACVYLRPSGVK